MRAALLGLCLFAVARAAAGDEQAPTAEQAFEAALAAHVAAIESRDLEALLDTITDGDRLTLIFPDASSTHTRREYVDFHRAWFADEGWTMDFEPVSNLVRGDLGIALVRTTYTDAAGPRGTLLALTFHRENGDWRLVFDQNTRIPAE